MTTWLECPIKTQTSQQIDASGARNVIACQYCDNINPTVVTFQPCNLAHDYTFDSNKTEI